MLPLQQKNRNTMLSLPCAKINIGLNVTGKRPDGYHNLETVFFPIPLTDVLEIKELSDSDKEDIQILGMPAGENPCDNLVYKVYSDMRKEFSLPPMSIYLYKKIPIGAGLGGGSSDAAETMKAINQMFALGMQNDEMERRIAQYGADCPFFIRHKPVFAEGIGDIMSDITVNLSHKHLVLVKPATSVSTREAYSGIVAAPADADLRESIKADITTWRHTIKNDFEKSVFKAHPEISAIKQTLYDMGALYASMSGSGSAVYGIFDRPVDEAKKVFDDCFTFEKQLR